jgi:hypothetical protein
MEIDNAENKSIVQKSKIKKPADKKLEQDGIQGRSRAKTTTIIPTFDKKPQAKKEIKPVQTIGSDRFSNLLSMFDKKQPDNKGNENARQVGKLDSNKFNAFHSNKEPIELNLDKKEGVTNNIKKRMENLLDNNKTKTTSGGYIDPIIQARKERLNTEVEKEEEEEDIGSDNLHISEEEEDI